jgi:hypothetical protein
VIKPYVEIHPKTRLQKKNETSIDDSTIIYSKNCLQTDGVKIIKANYHFNSMRQNNIGMAGIIHNRESASEILN